MKNKRSYGIIFVVGIIALLLLAVRVVTAILTMLNQSDDMSVAVGIFLLLLLIVILWFTGGWIISKLSTNKTKKEDQE